MKYEGEGRLSIADECFDGTFSVEPIGDSKIVCRFMPQEGATELSGHVGHTGLIQFQSGQYQVSAERAFLTSVGNDVRLKLPTLQVQSAVSNSTAPIKYELANCLYSMGSHRTEYANGGFAWNSIELVTESITARITKLRGYDQIVEALSRNSSAGTTCTLSISNASNVEAADKLAAAICTLLSLATKNSVRWTSREIVDSAGTSTEYVSPLLYPLRTHWALIPDIANDGTNQLFKFLTQALPNYRITDECLGLQTTVGWLLDAEFSIPIQPKFLLAFAAIERLRSRVLKGTAEERPLIHPRFNTELDRGLGDAIVNLVEASLGPLDLEAKKVLQKRLKDLNRPSIAASLDGLCVHFGVIASTRKMSHLRSRLMHAGDLGEFDFYEALDLYAQLSHVLDVCLLKALGFQGKYHHLDTKWKEKALTDSILELGSAES